MVDLEKMFKQQIETLSLQYENSEEDLLKKINKVINLFGGCRNCGECCKRIPCEITQDEIVRLCKRFDMSYQDFDDKYLKYRDTVPYLKTPCPFLDENNYCKIYEDRPSVCRTYPFNPRFPFVYTVAKEEFCELSQKIFDKVFEILPEEPDEKDEMWNVAKEFMAKTIGMEKSLTEDRFRDMESHKVEQAVVNEATLDELIEEMG